MKDARKTPPINLRKIGLITGFDAEACWPLNGPLFSPLNPVYSIMGAGATGPPLSTNWSGRVLQAISCVMLWIKVPSESKFVIYSASCENSSAKISRSWRNHGDIDNPVPQNFWSFSHNFWRSWTEAALFRGLNSPTHMFLFVLETCSPKQFEGKLWGLKI